MWGTPPVRVRTCKQRPINPPFRRRLQPYRLIGRELSPSSRVKIKLHSRKKREQVFCSWTLIYQPKMARNKTFRLSYCCGTSRRPSILAINFLLKIYLRTLLLLIYLESLVPTLNFCEAILDLYL